MNKKIETVEEWPIDKLIPYARNARTHSDAQVSQIASSIKEWGFTNPIIADMDGNIIAGHGRFLAAQKLGLKTVPVRVVSDWGEAKKKAYIIADNKLALNAEWDNELLCLELKEIEAANFDISLIGFHHEDISALVSIEQHNKLEKEYVGAKEYSNEAFNSFNHQCPRCGFEFNGKS
jgi:ParB-like chromosome segregation protein Spo0J